jgi:predicted dehydrogenase
MSVRIGFVGSGFAAMHMEALAEIPEAKVVAICSRNQSKANGLIAGKDIQYYEYEKIHEMLKKENLDAVYICVPPHLHGDLEVICSEYVKGLLIEKPVVLDLEMGYKLSEIFKKAGNIVCVGYMNRYRKNLIDAKSYFSKDPAVLMNGAWSNELPPPYWWRRREMSGGQLTEQCTHILDAIRYITGEFDEIQAMSTSGYINDIEDFNVDDAMIVNFKMKSGAIGNVQTSCFTKDHGGGALGIYLNIASREKSFRFSEHQMDLDIQHAHDNIKPQPSQENALLLENLAFLNALKKQSDKDILSSYNDALETLKVSFAADLSIRERRSVKISEL